ncbi:MAG TPA: glycoside hydrolase family 5 protein [Candidatus Sulfotelmatobacter sp.]|nr:glycoside hydrolase family 5 protein [Candidatus Sulfotelmatobacter sp.]
MLRRLLATLLFLSTASLAQTSPLSSVPGARLAHIRHGINLSEWFAQVYDPKGYTKEHFETWNTTSDIALIKQMGFDHVRLSVNPQPFMDDRHGDGAEYFGYLDAAMKMILDTGLAVELDMHPDSDFKSRLAKDDDFVERFTEFWRTVAQRYSSWDADRVFFEILNEPEMHDAYRWYGIEAKVAAAIRRAAPTHTIIAAGAKWDDDDDMVFLEPLPDANVVYVFHFYEPHIFTHQGATWGAYYWHWLKGLHYPSSPENAAQVATLVPEARERLPVIRYGQDHWGASRIEAEINQAAAWARQRHVPLICNEFGVYRNADPADRTAWLKDVHTALERHNIGWTMWDYSGSFGVVTKRDGKPTPDDLTLRALGLNASAGQ